MQNALALIVVFAAAAYLIWRAWHFLFAKRNAAGCESGCNQCPAGRNPQPLVTLELPPAREQQATK